MENVIKPNNVIKYPDWYPNKIVCLWNDCWVNLQTLCIVQPYAHAQILKDMQLHPGLTEWVMDPQETRSPAQVSFSAAPENPGNSSLNVPVDFTDFQQITASWKQWQTNQKTFRNTLFEDT